MNVEFQKEGLWAPSFCPMACLVFMCASACLCLSLFTSIIFLFNLCLCLSVCIDVCLHLFVSMCVSVSFCVCMRQCASVSVWVDCKVSKAQTRAGGQCVIQSAGASSATFRRLFSFRTKSSSVTFQHFTIYIQFLEEYLHEQTYYFFMTTFQLNIQTKGRFHEKKVAVLLDFVQITSPPPPPPNLDNLYNFFWTPKTSI